MPDNNLLPNPQPEADAPARARDARRAANAAERAAADAKQSKKEVGLEGEQDEREAVAATRAPITPNRPPRHAPQAQDEKRRAWDAEREAREEAEAEAARKAADDEAAAWMAQIQTEEAGETAVATEEESQGLLQEFVDYIVTRKTVGLEDLASAFGLRVSDAIQRVQALEAEGRLTGVMDDRGKFIHVSLDEMKVRRGGREGGEGGERGGSSRRLRQATATLRAIRPWPTTSRPVGGSPSPSSPPSRPTLSTSTQKRARRSAAARPPRRHSRSMPSRGTTTRDGTILGSSIVWRRVGRRRAKEQTWKQMQTLTRPSPPPPPPRPRPPPPDPLPRWRPQPLPPAPCARAPFPRGRGAG